MLIPHQPNEKHYGSRRHRNGFEQSGDTRDQKEGQHKVLNGNAKRTYLGATGGPRAFVCKKKRTWSRVGLREQD